MKTILPKLYIENCYYELEDVVEVDDDATDSEISEAVRQWMMGKVDYEWQSLG